MVKNMNRILALLSGLAAAGLVLSSVVHLYALAGKENPFGGLAWGLHVGIFVVWLPAVLAIRDLTKDFKQKDVWKAALRGCPAWMTRLTYFFLAYAFVNFFLFLYLEHTGAETAPKEIATFRGFSGHWMAFYSAAMSILYSATQVKRFDSARRCPHGHAVSPAANFCEECGAPVATPGSPK